MKNSNQRVLPKIPKIFFASRSHPDYLEKLVEIANRKEHLHLVSITGGLAFLHALSEETLSLTLVDRSPEVNNYTKIMLELIFECLDRESFFGVLSGHFFVESNLGEIQFTDTQFSFRNAILDKLSRTSSTLIETWYPVERFDVQSATTTTEIDTISFLYKNLRLEICNWLLGYGCFKSEETYSLMRNALMRLNPQILTMGLEEFPYSKCNGKTLVLASNTDSPLFTDNDTVLKAIQAENLPSIFYVSRTRDFSLPWQPQNELPQFSVRNRLLAVHALSIDLKLLANTFGGNWQSISMNQYCADYFYDFDCILFDLNNDPATSSDVLDSFTNSIPIHVTLVLVSIPEEVIKKYEDLLSFSYSLFFTNLENQKNIPVLVCELKHGRDKVQKEELG